MTATPGAVRLTWPDTNGRRVVTSRWTGERFGYVRSEQGRYFPEDADGFPLAGTFRTRHEAVRAVLAEGRGTS